MKDYGWEKPKTQAHNYLLNDLIKFLNYSNINLNSQILDAGCGGGFVLNELYKKGFKNVWGFDASKSGIDVVRKNYPKLIDRVEVHDAYMEKLPVSIPQSSYDLVISVEVIEHLYSPERYLENVNKWLKQGGYLILTTPYHGYLKNIAIALTNRFDSHFDPLWEGGHIKFFSKNSLNSILYKTGFRSIKFAGSGRLPYLWKSIIVTARK